MIDSENEVSLDSFSILAKVYFEKNHWALHPCADEIFPETTRIECAKGLKDCIEGQIVVVNVIEMTMENGCVYLYAQAI